ARDPPGDRPDPPAADAVSAVDPGERPLRRPLPRAARRGRAGGLRETVSRARRPLGRGQGPPPRIRVWSFRRPAPAALPRADARHPAGADPPRRADVVARPRLVRADRGSPEGSPP